jgi:uncharacterized integral membrane protein (TIGR00698 family)
MSTATARASEGIAALLPGFALAGAVAAGAFALRALPVPAIATISPLMLAILLGMAVRNTLGTPDAAHPGLAACLRRPLRFGIVLLGLQLTLAQVLEVGGAGLLILVVAVAGTYLFTLAAGRVLGVDPKLTQLIGVGTSICGASAVIAANTVVRDRDGGVPYALAVVTLYGTIAMFAYPLLMQAFGLTPHAYGLWVGASVHEVAQVVAAGFAGGQDAGAFGTITKLTRVLLLAPMVLLLGWYAARAARAAGGDEVHARPPTPWFVFGFLAMVGVASTGVVTPDVRPTIVLTTQAILAFALAAVGLETDFRRIAARGWRALLLGALATLFIASLSLGLVLLLGENAA